MSATAYSCVSESRPVGCFAVFAVHFDVEHGSLQAASDRADEIAQAWGEDRERFCCERIWL